MIRNIRRAIVQIRIQAMLQLPDADSSKERLQGIRLGATRSVDKMRALLQ